MRATKKLLTRWNKDILLEVNKQELEQLKKMIASSNFEGNVKKLLSAKSKMWSLKIFDWGIIFSGVKFCIQKKSIKFYHTAAFFYFIHKFLVAQFINIKNKKKYLNCNYNVDCWCKTEKLFPNLFGVDRSSFHDPNPAFKLRTQP